MFLNPTEIIVVNLKITVTFKITAEKTIIIIIITTIIIIAIVITTTATALPTLPVIPLQPLRRQTLLFHLSAVINGYLRVFFREKYFITGDASISTLSIQHSPTLISLFTAVFEPFASICTGLWGEQW